MGKKRFPRTMLATVCIPWTEEYEFDEKTFCNQIKRYKDFNMKHLYIFGTAGEGFVVNEEQYEMIVSVFAREMKKHDMYPIVGIMNASLPIMHQRLKKAYEFGIRDFQFPIPGWTRLSDKEMWLFFHNFCDPYPDCKFMIYNDGRSKRLLNVQDFVKLAEEIPNVVSAKFTSANFTDIHEIVDSQCPIQFFLPGFRTYGYASMLGEFGYLMALSCTNPERARSFFQAGIDRDFSKMGNYIQELHRIFKKLIKIIGPDKVDGAVDKIYSKNLDNDFPLRLQPPYEALTDEQFQEYSNFLKKDYPQWICK